MPTSGLMFVTSRIIDPSKTSDEQYNKFYNEEHLPDVLSYKISKVAKRYKNTNADSTIPYLALYPVDDSGFFSSPELGKLIEDTRISKTFGNKDIYDFVDFGLRAYEKIQTYEGLHFDPATKPDPSSHAQTLLAVAMEPAEGSDQDFDDWYRKQHLDMFAMLAHYRRTTRYKRVDGEKPRYLALHEIRLQAQRFPAAWNGEAGRY